MRIHVILITYALDPAPLFKAADGEDITWHVFMHSRNQAVWDAVIDYPPKGRMEMYDYGVNRGLARSWNEGIIDALKMKAEAIIVINDDMLATHDDVTDAGLAQVSRLPGLAGLNVSGTKVTDAGLIHLKQVPKLTKLNVTGTLVTEQGVKDAKKYLPFWATVTR